MQTQQHVQQSPAQTHPPVPHSQQQTVSEDSPVSKERSRKTKLPKSKKKRSAKRFFKKLGIFAAVLAFIGVLWFSIGNYITLTIHSSEVVETINAGSLNLSGVFNNDFEKLPTYLQNKLKKPQPNNGPLIDMMLPYIRIECVKVNGFFGGSSVEYRVMAPDVESWLLELDASTLRNQDDFLSTLEQFIQNAPRSARTVTVQYHADGWLQWQGNYNTPEFLDALTGGMNTAYTKLYEAIMDELEDILQ